MTDKFMTPTPIDKPWGTTRRICQREGFELWHASIKAGGRSTDGKLHRHNRHCNELYVVSGVIQVWFADGTVTVLDGGQNLWIAAGVWHRFNAITGVELIETYYPMAASAEHDTEREFEEFAQPLSEWEEFDRDDCEQVMRL